MSKRTLRNACIWAALALGIALLTGQSVSRYYDLFRRGVVTDGVVVASEPDNHRNVEYRLVVNGQEYSNGHWGWAARVGERIPVTYLPEDPRVSCPGSARAWLDNEIMFVGMAVLLMPFVLVGIIDARLQRLPE
jgi:hypothetical protein